MFVCLSSKDLSPTVQEPPFEASVDASIHRQALQNWINGDAVAYQDTLRVVKVEGSRYPRDRYPHQERSPVYILSLEIQIDSLSGISVNVASVASVFSEGVFKEWLRCVVNTRMLRQQGDLQRLRPRAIRVSRSSAFGLRFTWQNVHLSRSLLPPVRSTVLDDAAYEGDDEEEILMDSTDLDVEGILAESEDEEEEVMAAVASEGGEQTFDEVLENTAMTASTEEVEEEAPSECPAGFSLNFLWLDKCIAVAVDQIFNKEQRSPMTEYFIWPKTDAWEELKGRLSENPWIAETDQVLLLNRATEVINFWQDEKKTHSLDEARSQFPDCSFSGS